MGTDKLLTMTAAALLRNAGPELVLAVIVSAGALSGAQVADRWERPRGATYSFEGEVGRRLRANLENWELQAPDANPAMLRMLVDRDRLPDRKLLPWSGEFVGKYLCASLLSYRILRDPRQKELIGRVARGLMASQGADGYLGPFNAATRLTGKNWDIWGHYWAVRALLMYYDEFGEAAARETANRAAGLLVRRFLDKDIALTNDGSSGQMNYAVIHAFTMLYALERRPEYLAMARWIVKQWEQPGAGMYMSSALAGKEMFEFPGNRWESLHDFQGMAGMYRLTGEAPFGEAFTRIWNSILKGDRHNTGGFTSGEKTTGNPYDRHAIETCCTVAWIDLSTDMLKLGSDPLVADELELSTFNGGMGAQHPSGRWWTYNTPMDGEKKASAHDIVFQARAGSPELNCCSVNGPRTLGLLTEWAVLTGRGGKEIVLNYYGPAAFTLTTPGGRRLRISEETSYPADGAVKVRIGLDAPERFALLLRIPAWSARTKVAMAGSGGAPMAGAIAGQYLTIDRAWKNNDAVDLELDMSPHFWAGERECGGLVSAYRGPILLTFDPAFNDMDPDKVPPMEAGAFGAARPAARAESAVTPWVLYAVKAADGVGSEVRLCDFASAGAQGNTYRSWLPIRGVAPVAFDRRRPVWGVRP
jgi:uncharacterized protein